jgi:hypothetical protein
MTDSTDQAHNESPPGGGADSAVGMNWYLQFLHQQMTLQREFSATWAAAVTSLSSAVLGQWQTVEHIVAGHADQLAERAHGAERVTRDLAERVEIAAERTLGNISDHQSVSPPPGHHPGRPVPPWATRQPVASAAMDAPAEHVKATPDIFDELLELIVDEDIKAAIP